MRRQQGASLVLVLGVLTLLFTVGAWFLATRLSARRSLSEAQVAAQTKALARAGLEDAKANLSRDHTFPPAGALTQESFTYTETLNNTDGDLVGSFTVSLDRSLDKSPHHIVRVNSVGALGDPSNPRARRVLYAEWDTSPVLRDDPTSVNPNLGRWCYYQDRG